ncbi:MAG: ParB N-terminal domain-containing protein [Spirochaetales bacterium]|nr:ParB N-terminal domain-containing protein [Spirochaetales bacterium]
MQLPVDAIKIKKRIRKDLGDLSPLVASIKKYGQLSPIIVDPDYILIAGHRRLEAVKRLGLRTIEVIVTDSENEIDKIEIELEENIQRRNLSTDEISDGINTLHRLRNPNIIQRIINFFKRLFRWLIKNLRNGKTRS